MNARGSAVRAIVIWGLPDNIQERELPNLLWALPEYHDCWMRSKNRTVTGFARFMTPNGALAAVKKLHYHTFDSIHQIKCELACRDPRAGEFVNKRGDDAAISQNNGEFSDMDCGGDCNDNTGYQKFRNGGRGPMKRKFQQSQDRPAQRKDPQKVFIGKLSAAICQDELQEELEKHDGFKKMRIVKKENQAMVFAEFETSSQAAEVIGFYSESGFCVPSSPGKGVVEFARDDGQRMAANYNRQQNKY